MPLNIGVSSAELGQVVAREKVLHLLRPKWIVSCLRSNHSCFWLRVDLQPHPQANEPSLNFFRERMGWTKLAMLG
ncbi:hypothetical protein SAMN06265368_0970 [Cohaesibacter gelatinilyticus]|uniref:Uncharacterized protein n=1 Tax=Cohaesibacter gelatinilyticus TaxID=372072 RepID=A0A285NEQ1_9HYPH|nr:hypothetical protein SAMN06265368_0970 [Cohaesibacter gelatinilyticus]